MSSVVSSIFNLAEAQQAVIIVPAIAVAEMYYLSSKVGHPMASAALLEELDSLHGIAVSTLGRTHLELLDQLPDITEMHDRLIAAEALALGAPLLTRDAILTGMAQVETVW